MPCTPGMTGCVKNCAHRRLVEEYRLARHNEEIAREHVTKGHSTETVLYRQDHGPLITFQQWLLGHTQPQPETITAVAA